MSQIALFHSVLGVRSGERESASRLMAAGHQVEIVDQYEGRSFDDYDQAGAYAEGIGYPALMHRAVEAVSPLDDGFVAVGFSNGGGMAEFVATERPVGGVVMISGTLPLEMLDKSAWPAGVPAQIHYTTRDPLRRQEWTDSLVATIRSADVHLESFDYPGKGHLFADASLPEEYEPANAVLLWSRVLAFCDRVVTGGSSVE